MEILLKTTQMVPHDSPKEVTEGALIGDEITLINDIDIGVLVCVGNGFLGIYSIGYVMPGNSVKLPGPGAALLDVYLMRTLSAHVFVQVNFGQIYYEVMKSNVNSNATLKVSEFFRGET